MTRDEKIIKLYEETYQDESTNGVTLEEMEDSLEAYYQAAGFNFKKIDELLDNNNLEEDFVKHMQEKLASVTKY